MSPIGPIHMRRDWSYRSYSYDLLRKIHPILAFYIQSKGLTLLFVEIIDV